MPSHDHLRNAIEHIDAAIAWLRVTDTSYLLERSELQELSRSLSAEWHNAHNRKETA